MISLHNIINDRQNKKYKFVYADRLKDVLFMNAQPDNLIEVHNMNFSW